MKNFARTRPVRSVKEIVDSVTLAVAAGVITTIDVVTAVNSYTGTVGTVPIGATVSAISLQVSYTSDAGVSSNFDWYIAKNAAGSLAFPTPGVTGGNALRRFIFHEEKGLTGNVLDGSLTKNNVLLLIPPRFKRMGESDKIQLKARGAVEAYDMCVKAIYKWYA